MAYIKASNAGADDLFGSSVALTADGSTLVVGAPTEDSAATTPQARPVRRMCSRAQERRGQRAYVKATNTGAGDRFGTSLAVSASGSTLVVGAPREASRATGVDGDQLDNTAPSGAVYVFERHRRSSIRLTQPGVLAHTI